MWFIVRATSELVSGSADVNALTLLLAVAAADTDTDAVEKASSPSSDVFSVALVPFELEVELCRPRDEPSGDDGARERGDELEPAPTSGCAGPGELDDAESIDDVDRCELSTPGVWAMLLGAGAASRSRASAPAVGGRSIQIARTPQGP